jgi:hypothetical protein
MDVCLLKKTQTVEELLKDSSSAISATDNWESSSKFFASAIIDSAIKILTGFPVICFTILLKYPAVINNDPA